MKSIQEALRQKQSELQQVLNDAVRQKQSRLDELQKVLLTAQELLNELREADGDGAMALFSEEEINRSAKVVGIEAAKATSESAGTTRDSHSEPGGGANIESPKLSAKPLVAWP